MKSSPNGIVLALAALAFAVVAIPNATNAGQGSAAMGKSHYRGFCKSCHGESGKGDGPLAESLVGPAPTDLTVLAKENGGEFPAERVRRIVDGREPVEGHGSSQMPVWGNAFANADPEGGDAAVDRKIDDLVAFLATIQAKE